MINFMLKKHILLLILGISIIGNSIFFVLWQKASKQDTDFVIAQEKFPYLSKRILQEFPQDILINFLDLRSALREQVKPFGDDFGFYFEYLPTGTSIGIHEKVEFHAASLFKVPVVMAYYHIRERTNRVDDQILSIQKDQIDGEFGDLWKRGEGAKIKASEAVRLTLIDSDNTAAKLLVPFVTQQDFNAVYEALDVDLQTDEEGALISAKNYSSILKALYFSSVLSQKSSQEILALLTQTKFPDKLASGVPQGIPVAHKIGDFIDKTGKQGFRDCGIVYVPRRPYLLCMFSVGDEQTARVRMQAVSRTVYDYVSHTKNSLY